MIRRALDSSIEIVREDLSELKKIAPLEPGDFVRERGDGELREDV